MLVFAGSPPRTGSTLCYQLTAKLIEHNNAGKAITPYWTADNPIYQKPLYYASQNELYLTKKTRLRCGIGQRS